MSKEHWQNIYNTKEHNEVSWTQEYPALAMEYLDNLALPKNAKIIDIGGGASQMPDVLLELGYNNITILDISDAALNRSKQRLGDKASKVKWITTDILNFDSDKKYDFWYDRAVFHFLTKTEDIESYIDIAVNKINSDGHLLLGTFSDNGPLKCSGLEVSRYSSDQLIEKFTPQFNVIRCFKEQHKTPFDTIQEFQFCGFKK